MTEKQFLIRPLLILGSCVLLVLPRDIRADDSLPHRFQKHIDYLASDELGGRGVGAPGIELAAEYIAREFASAGLTPAGEKGTFFQTFPITLHRELKDDGRLEISGDSIKRRQGADFIPFNFSSDDEFSGGLMFIGYGAANEERKYDDFSGADLTGSVALMFRGEPPSWAGEDGSPTPHATFRSKVYNAKDRGAAAVLIVNQAPAEGEKDDLAEFIAEGADQYGIPAFHITRSMAQSALAAARLGTLEELQKKLDSGSPASSPMAHMKAGGKASFEKRSSPTRNVVGLRAGSGPHADEYVVIGAHYDHLGVRKPMMRKFKEGKIVEEPAEPQIHNGADDNASGTSALIEIARLFAEGPPPQRSILFAAFTAEESGLHGSKYYVDDPIVPLEKTVAMLNMDMVGRMKSDESAVQVFGTDCGSTFAQIVESEGGHLGLKIAPGVDFGGRSDHASFLRKDIPSMHFYTGAHTDYHKPSDDADKINAEGGAKVSQLVHAVAKELAERPDRPTFVAPKRDKAEPAAAGTPTYRVVMGLTPAYGDDGRPGMGVDAVSPEGPAEMAGMRAGDRIIRINGKPVANVYDYMAATRNNKSGDSVEVVVLREGAEHTLRVTLAGAR